MASWRRHMAKHPDIRKCWPLERYIYANRIRDSLMGQYLYILLVYCHMSVIIGSNKRLYLLNHTSDIKSANIINQLYLIIIIIIILKALKFLLIWIFTIH